MFRDNFWIFGLSVGSVSIHSVSIHKENVMDRIRLARELVGIAKDMVAWGRFPTMPRSSYIPKNAPNLQKLKDGQEYGLEIWTYENDKGKLYGLAFKGKANKPLWHFSFPNKSALDRKVRDTVQSAKSSMEYKQERRKERQQFKHSLKEGDILVSSWGYDQTNVSWFQVVGVTDKAVKLREIQSRGMGRDHVIPLPNRFSGPVSIKMVSPGDSVKINSFQRASRWDGKPKYETALGWGH
jgi:hypothetical protein